MKTLKYEDKSLFEKLGQFIHDKNTDPEVTARVESILADIKTRGDRAVLDYTEKFDGFKTTAKKLRIAESDLKFAVSELSSKERKAIREAIRCVKEFHKKGLPKSWRARNPHGAIVGETWYPISRVGIYIPAGNVPLVSTAVMTTTLAHLAGVASIAVFTPANREGEISKQMLAGISLCGVSEVYRIGGAQAIGAMAFGTKTISPVDKIMGPGNAYVAEAQRQVFGQVGIDLIPGPSEALVLADKTANARYLAADLLAQAEHGSGREKVYFVFTSQKQLREVQAEIEIQLKSLKHAAKIKTIFDKSTLAIQVANLSEAVKVTNYIAPEHLELHVDKIHYKKLIQEIKTAGAILCGHETPTVLGDFTAGPSHTLPTGRTGRFFSGLKILDFMRRSSVVEYDRKSLAKARDVVSVFSELENLDAHGNSMKIRFEKES